MIIFAELFLFGMVALGVIRLLKNEIEVKVLRAKNEKLEEDIIELQKILLEDDTDRLGKPPRGQQILHG